MAYRKTYSNSSFLLWLLYLAVSGTTFELNRRQAEPSALTAGGYSSGRTPDGECFSGKCTRRDMCQSAIAAGDCGRGRSGIWVCCVPEHPGSPGTGLWSSTRRYSPSGSTPRNEHATGSPDRYEDYSEYSENYYEEPDARPLETYDEIRRTEYSVSSNKNHDNHDYYGLEASRPHSAGHGWEATPSSGGCAEGSCVRRDACRQGHSIASSPTGDCAWRMGEDWVCCRNTRTTGRPRWTEATTASYSPVTAVRWHTPKTGTTTTTAKPSRECAVGTCVRSKDCASRDIARTGSTDTCSKRRSSQWVCCDRKASVGASTRKPPTAAQTGNSNWTKRTEATTAIPRRPASTGKPWKNSTRSGSAASALASTTSRPLEECSRGQCVRVEDCRKEDIAISLRDTCRKRPTGKWICCLKKRSSAPRVTTHASTTKQTIRNTSREMPTTPAPRTSSYAGCGLREGIQRRDRRSTDNFVHPEVEILPGYISLWNSFFPSAKVVGGKEAEPYSWPWMAALFRVNSPGMNRFLCAGTLVSSRYVLTAAHVFTPQDIRNATSFLVMLGTHTGSEAVLEFRVKTIQLHPKYQHRFYYNDLALLELERAVTFNSFVYPVCLPSGDAFCEDSSLVGKRVTVTGWGDEAFGGKSSDVLKQATFPVISRESCNASYVRVASSTFPRGITEKMLCAGAPSGGRDACQGDSGGPLILKEGRHWVQVGIVSFGYRCGDSQYPGVYTKVGYYVDWIREKVRR